MKKSIIFKTLVIALTTLFIGCATIMAPTAHPLSLNAEQDATEVYINGTRMGTTPLQVELTADKSYTIEFRKNGYEPITRVVNPEVGGGWIILDILFGFVPLIVDAATGAWNNLDQNSVDVNLNPQNN
ncbi:PEGA domain-containing protein [bacterium]|nr:PEGA domain-containing protein [bacterium]